MDSLKENKEKKNQKEETREKQQPPPRTREVLADDIVYNSTAWNNGITRKLLAEAANVIGMSADEVNAWQKYMDESGWCFTNGRPVNGTV